LIQINFSDVTTGLDGSRLLGPGINVGIMRT